MCVLAVPLQRVADQQVILDIARKKFVALVADSARDVYKRQVLF